MIKRPIFRKKNAVKAASLFAVMSVLSVQLTLFTALPASAVSDIGMSSTVSPYNGVVSELDAAEAVNAMKQYGCITVIEQLSLPLLENAVTRTLKYSYSAGWQAGNGVSEVRNAQTVSIYPWDVLEGGSCVEVKMEGEVGDTHRAEQHFDGGLDLSDDSYLVFAVNIPYAATTRTELDVSLECVNGASVSQSAVIESSGWNGIFLDISGLDGRENANKLSIGVKYGSDIYLGENNAFYIDYPAAASDSCLRTYRFLSDSYIGTSGQLRYDESSLCHILTTPTAPQADGNYESSIETSELSYNLMGDANALRLTFLNTVGCTSVTCRYITDRNQSFEDGRSYTCLINNATGSSTVSCLFPIYGDYIYQLQFIFKSKSQGDISLCSLTTASAAFSPSETIGSVDRCQISENKRNIIVCGKIPAETVSQYQGSKVCLFETDASAADVTTGSLSYMTPVAQTNISVEYTLKKSYRDMSCLNKKYTVAVQTDSGYIIIGQQKYISNPKILASADTVRSTGVMKGIITESTEAQQLGSANTVIKVNLGKLLTNSDNTEKYSFNGQSYEFDRTELEKLDSEINAYKNSDTEVYLRLVLELNESDIAALNGKSAVQALVHPNALLTPLPDVQSYAFNTSDAKGMNALGAATHFLSSRYASEGAELISGYIMGHNINAAYKTHYAGEMTLAEFSKSCAASLRVIYNSAQTVNSALRVYISFGSDWYSSMPAESLFRYDTRELLLSIGRAIKSGGDFEWMPCFGTDTEYISEREQKNGSLGYEVKKITPAFFASLCNFMGQSDITYNGSARSIMLLSDEFHSYTAPQNSEDGTISDDIAAAEFAYAFYRASCSGCKLISKFIITPYFSIEDHADLLRYIDSDSSLSYTSKYLSVLFPSTESWTEIVGEDPAVFTASLRNVIEATVLTGIPSTIKGNVPLWQIDSDGNTDGWAAAEHCRSITATAALDREKLLVADFLSSSKTDWKGIYNEFSYQRDFSNFPFISFEANLLTVPSGVDCAELCVILYSGNNYIFANTLIMSGQWNKIVIPIGNFKGIGAVDCVKIFVRGIDGQTDIGTPTLAISDFVGLSDRYDSSFLTSAVENERNQNSVRDREERKMMILVTAVAAAAAAIVAESVHIAVRAKRARSLAAEKEKTDDLRFRFGKK